MILVIKINTKNLDFIPNGGLYFPLFSYLRKSLLKSNEPCNHDTHVGRLSGKIIVSQLYVKNTKK